MLSYLTNYLLALVLIPLLDTPWLLYQSSTGLKSLVDVQGGRPIQMNITAGVPVYFALAYLLLEQHTVYHATLTGIAVYAVYEFTNLAIFKDYSLVFALSDTLWGGVLFALAFLVLQEINVRWK